MTQPDERPLIFSLAQRGYVGGRLLERLEKFPFGSVRGPQTRATCSPKVAVDN